MIIIMIIIIIITIVIIIAVIIDKAKGNALLFYNGNTKLEAYRLTADLLVLPSAKLEPTYTAK